MWPDSYAQRHAANLARAISARENLRAVGICGFLATSFGMIPAFVPSRNIESIGLFEAKMVIGLGLFVAVASASFWSGPRRRPHPAEI